jgi:hypothetical protein
MEESTIGYVGINEGYYKLRNRNKKSAWWGPGGI